MISRHFKTRWGWGWGLTSLLECQVRVNIGESGFFCCVPFFILWCFSCTVNSLCLAEESLQKEEGFCKLPICCCCKVESFFPWNDNGVELPTTSCPIFTLSDQYYKDDKGCYCHTSILPVSSIHENTHTHKKQPIDMAINSWYQKTKTKV